ncbi:hypothetical protein AAVH_30798 [Aphelenchoides avenae]|nr:hypothetical protein AAVH_30798 [Aphelenchus avenae]
MRQSTNPAQTTQYPTNTAAIAQKLWNAIRDPNTETRLRTLLVDLYFVMYGRETPLILRPNAQRFQPMDENASVLGSSTLPSTFAFNAV